MVSLRIIPLFLFYIPLSKNSYFCAMIVRLKYWIHGAMLLLAAMLLPRCANPVAPTGGAKDVLPPVVVKAEPENHSTDFGGRKIEITFDEYVTLENANQNVLISPPLATKPDIKLNNKTLVIKFKEALETNTTYTIDFGSAIKDLHEGNQFKDYVYSFSTGSHIDTLSIAGKLLSAEDKKPVEDAYVSLYAANRDNLDSLPMTVAPNYITKTDKEGHFRFSGLADKKYLVFALKDVNSNLFFDLPNEEVAFLDTLVPASFPWKAPPVQPVDSLVADSVVLAMDSLDVTPSDSLPSLLQDTVPQRVFDQNALNLTLYMFTEVDSTQVLLEKKLVEEGLLRFVFRHPAKEATIMTPEMLPDTFNLVTTQSPDFDTVWWYFSPKVKDSLWVHVKYDTIINDSSRYSLKFKQQNARRNQPPEKLKVSNNLIGQGALIHNKDLILKFSEPIVRCEMPDSVAFKHDTTVFYNVLVLEPVDERGMEYKLVADLKDGVNYSFELPDSVFFGIRGRTNDPIKVDFHLLKDDEYGNIYITVAPPEGMKQVVVQLINESGKVIQQQAITKKQEVMFEHLLPAKYKLRAILDTDGNGKWSTGNYHRRTLPETVLDYKDPLDLKAGWDIDLDEIWEL
jgi:hypothetical protein